MRHWRQVLLGLITLTLLTPALCAANPCATGGAPVMRDGTGQGGTGLRPQDADGSGRGGTGISPLRGSGGDGSGSGGTGHTVEVEGVITGFASICVNGLELHYHPATPVTIHDRAASPSDLAVGQVVRALAKGKGDQLTVQRVHVRHLLVAEVQGLDSGALLAQGRNISLNPATVLPAGLVPGVKVAVSGFAGARGHVVATRLDVVPDDTPDSLTGEVQRNARGELTVDGVTLEGRLTRLEPGAKVRVEGRYAQGRMEVTRFEREERAMHVDRVIVQGLVRHADKSGFNIGGQHFLIDTQTRGKQTPPGAGEWAIVDAVRKGNTFHAREVEAQSHPGNNVNKPAQRGGGAGENAPKQEQAQRPGSPSGSSNHEVEHSEKHESGKRKELREKTEHSEEAKHSEKIETPEKVEHSEKIETPEKVERPEKIETPEKVERPEKIETPEKVERPEKIETPERIERIERHEHDV
ncbi:MAG: hypothetical protein KKA22_14275 [Gammaproteobacteria bacterium]|nr:hypothetical protein [Gammaproteobacteria bacterium]MBU1409304.1 hypothetical protein [Gammaproteobacteria bacterium]MBU1531200.1 hypothetical protein [Gammaproteobacteria bacterium]